MNYLVDVNVWVALAVADHVHHHAALDWFNALDPGDEVVLCRVTQMGFLRLLTNRSAMKSDTLTAAEAWRTYDTWASMAAAKFKSEPAGFDSVWREITRRAEAGSSFWTNAYLAAFAKAGGHRIVSFDRGFKRHKVALRLLTPSG